MLQSVRVLGFNPTTNGLHFLNDYPSNTVPDYTFTVLGQTLTLGDAGNGLCGGYVFTVKDCFDSGILPPTDTARPAGGSPLFNYIVARLTQGFDESDLNQYLSWMQMTDGDTPLGSGVASHEINEEWPRIKADLDSNLVSPLALVHGQEPPTVGFFTGIQNLGHCHQVLAWGYDLNGSSLTIFVYDPDFTGNSNTITLDLSHPGSATPISVSNWPAGTYRGFFRTHYSFHNPRTSTSAAFIQTVVTSPGITSPGPVAHTWTDQTWLTASGNPLIRFTGSVHDFSASVTVAPADIGRGILQLRAVITTGSDDLRGGTGPTDNCDAILTFSTGATITIQNINDGAHWNNGETHTAILPLPAGTVAGNITRFDLHTSFGGGLSGDNWNVNAITLIASLLPATVVQPPPPVVRTWVNLSGNPLVRFTGSVHDFQTAVSTVASDAAKVIQQLSLTIKTGSDDLRGGTGANDNASVILTIKNAPFTISNINQGAHWNNNEVHTVSLNVPAGTKSGDITSLTLHTSFGGGIGGDNWNVNQITLQAVLPGP
jgi:hypothetical protein